MEENIKEEINKLSKIKIQVRGVVFKTDTAYILAEKGEEGLKRLESELEKIGHPIKYKEIKSMEFYPAGLRVISLLVIKEIFGFDDKKIENMGLVATKKSIIIKLFVKFFLSLQRVFFKEAPRIWQKHWTGGEVVPVELNEEKKYAILRLKNFNLHPLYCSVYLQGYFAGILQMLVKSSQISCRETKCSFKGDEYHEYLIKWE